MKLLKLTVLVAMVLTLSACEDSAKILSFKALPDSLKDCTFIRLKN